MGENTEFRRGITNDNKIMYKFNDKSLARYRYKQNQNPSTRLDLYDLVSHQTLSVIAPIFLKMVFVKLPDRMSR